mmetsp:Transcript_775/g.2331  ORF Transcript_775/g.2331 Transcript_775/m.2331 type:complete len:515 (+) Transcript_775:243-1787(+)
MSGGEPPPFSPEQQKYLDAHYSNSPPPDYVDVHWLLYNGVLVFLMQCGFAMLCAGSVRAKNAQNILLKNIVDVCVGALGFWSTGFAFAYGNRGTGNFFIGTKYFFLSKGFAGGPGYHTWFFQFAFAATAATIVSGAVAERCQLKAYAAYSAMLTAFVYPVVAHWVWSEDGWLSSQLHDPVLGVGVVDFAGSGVVHMVGGAAAGIGAWTLGPRIGRFPDEHDDQCIERAMLESLARHSPIRGHSRPLVCLGTFLLWVAWYGFNCGSTLHLDDETGAIAARVAVVTTLGGASGGLSSLFVTHYTSRRRRAGDDESGGSGTYDVTELCNGIIAGLVAVTAGCAVIEPWAALVVGTGGAAAYHAGAAALVRLRVDDAVNAAPVHYGAGLWGLLAPGFLAAPKNVRAVYGADRGGVFYDGDARILACNLAAACSITLWVVLTMGPYFYLLWKYGYLRVSMDKEIDGLDDAKHGGAAYAFDNSKQGSKSDEHKMSELESIGEEVSSLRDSETGTAADLDA